MISAPLIEYLKKGIFTLLGLILAVYLFVILMTYTGNDPSWSHISSDMTTINNMGGEAGAWLSDLLYSFFGFGAWWLLAFVIYESILIWWDNKPTFWLMRVVAYVFLLLSASALFAQCVALVQQITNPAATALEGVAGGIIGLELQVRLAQLLSQWGSVLFLAVFVVITATFAFNIHWMALYQKVTALSWFGSGVKDQALEADEQATSQNKVLNKDNNTASSNETPQEGPAYEQLPLTLQSAGHAETSDNSGRFNNVLSDFLTKSGLADSVKASIAVAQANTSSQTASSDPAQDNYSETTVATPNMNGATTDSTIGQSRVSTAASPAPASVRKVEPSFAWNDANTVDDLLASEQAAYYADSMTEPATSAVSDSILSSETSVDSINEEPTESAPHTVAAPSMGQTEVQTTVRPKTNIVQPPVDAWAYSDSISPESVAPALDDSTATVDKVDTLADAWLAEHAEVLEPTISKSKPNSKPNSKSDASWTNSVAEPPLQAAVTQQSEAALADEPVTSSHSDSANKQTNEAFETASEITAHSSKQDDSVSNTNTVSSVEVDSPVSLPVAEVASASSVVDMTPTNTPPTNPKAAPTVEAINPNTNTQPVAAKPTMSFAVPEGDSSNHITDMMPDDGDYDNNETHTPVMPHISDDAAFSQKSRSMQTAQYRSSLTPIPEMSILDKPDPDRKPSYTLAELEQLSELLEIKLQEFNVKASVVNAIPGPVVTRFEVELAPGIKASKVTGISRDLARSLSMASLRVVEVIPGKPYIGIEVPNKQREMVRLIELLNTDKFKDPKAQISMAMGKDIGGNPIITDLARAPHMLVAGTTGSGKSVLVNSMLLSMLLKYTPNELRLILIDPKQLELANYNDIPHLLTPVVTDMTEAASSLSWCVAEMERRYQLMSLLKVRKLNEFNKKVIAAEKAGKPMLDPLWRPNDSVSISQAPKLKTLPMIVIVADEFADMIMQVGKQAEELITRLAQKSRAAGIHLMLATQRPSVDVITGLIKANIPVRAALRVNSKVDSRTILDSGGAEDMLGNGDMLFLGPGQIEPDRVHGAYVSDEEVNRVCDAWRERGAPDYIDNMAGNFELSSPGGNGGGSNNASGEDDGLYNDAVAFIMETRKVSASSIQRKFSIGYNRAARIVDSMEEAGLVSSMGKSGKRELLM
ncbi:DNA translocase FtsK 4TM domain-containing protein [Psychrobacter sp. B38]|uniref:DNA translocase FtsK n=1 Tax=Psychrobacter sp. B38 TaxID=3143538 RepID=UPI00320D257B